MSRRTVSSILACVLLVLLFAVAVFLPVPYVTMSPGPTVDVLAETKGEEIVQVDGAKRYETDGRLELTTVSVTGPGRDLTLVEALAAWFDKTRALYPRDVVYSPDQSPEDVETESNVQMVSSQDTAIAAALTELGYDLPTTAEVLAVSPGAPAEGKLRVRDQILAIDGEPVQDANGVSEAVQRAGVGEPVSVRVLRRGAERTVTLTTEASADDPDTGVIGIVVGQGYRFPFDVSVNIEDDIGGPSAGLIFSLAVFDTLTPGALTDGAAVAGTGTIEADGSVGPIGGIQQKIVAAADSGAELFLVPPDNCGAALAAPVDEEEITLVRADTMHSAVESLEAYAADENADLPECE
ncbi:MAG TPA: PDZ domain-containing protein [Nocardioidaceae bacterium]|nr:PDZ domain-containing protein [Nocardioidaceae bacterium]